MEDKKETNENNTNQKEDKTETSTEKNGSMDVEGGAGDTPKSSNPPPVVDPKEMEVD